MAAQRYERQAGRARRDGVDGLMVEILLAGETAGDAAGTETRNIAGGMVFNDLAQGHAHVSSGTRTLLMSIPRVVAERNGIDVRALHGRHVSPAAAGLLRSHLLAAHAALPDITPTHGERLGQMVIDLMGVALDIDGARVPVATRAARETATLLAARRLIDDHLGSPLLGVGWLCGQLGVPRSRLYRLFEAEGGVQAYVRNRRLDRVAAALRMPGSGERLADLAERWGFSDAAHLSRAFRERFGMTPGDYREGGGG